MATFRGSCLCGEVAFEVEGPFDRFLNCHCSRCRKATGTAHSCEVIVKASALRWLRGESSVARYDLPTARSFATAFCSICGSPMPHLTRSGREAIIHAGAFDEPLHATPGPACAVDVARGVVCAWGGAGGGGVRRAARKQYGLQQHIAPSAMANYGLMHSRVASCRETGYWRAHKFHCWRRPCLRLRASRVRRAIFSARSGIRIPVKS